MAVEVILPRVDMDMTSGIISKWHARAGDRVVRGSALFEIETGKASMEIDSPADGILDNILVVEGGSAPVGVAVAYILEEGETAVQISSSSTRTSEPVPESARLEHPTVTPLIQTSIEASASQAPRATPLARRLAREARLELKTISGTGPHGRITAEDVRGANMHPPHSQILLSMSMTCRMDSLLEITERLNAITLRTPGGQTILKITPEAVAIKALALAIQRLDHPLLTRASIRHGSGHILPNVSERSLSEITGLLETPDASGSGTAAIAVWPLFQQGIEQAAIPFTPPDIASLTMGAIVETFAPVNGEPVLVKQMICTFLCDSRLIRPDKATQFLQSFRRFLEDPVLMLA